MIFHFLGGTQGPSNKGDLLIALEKLLTGNLRDGKKTVVVIDEAHAILDPDIFEEVRLLLNLQTDNKFLLTLLLLGQDELKERVENNKQLDQRIAIRYHLEGLTAEETSGYVHHRLLIAGAKSEIFDADALAMVYLRSGGIPRRINQICDMSLLTARTHKSDKIAEATVHEAVESLEK